MSKHSQSSKNLGLMKRLNSLSSSEQISEPKTHLTSSQRLPTQTSAIRLGDYVHQRKFGKQKLISEQVKSFQLVGEEDSKAKQLKFVRDNINRLCDRISSQISRRKEEMKEMDYQKLKEQENYMERVLQMVTGKNCITDERKKCSSTIETTISSNPNSSTSSKDIGSSILEKRILQRATEQKHKEENLLSSLNRTYERRLSEKETLRSKKRQTTLTETNQVKELGIESEGQDEKTNIIDKQKKIKFGEVFDIEEKTPAPKQNLRKLKSLLTPKFDKERLA